MEPLCEIWSVEKHNTFDDLSKSNENVIYHLEKTESNHGSEIRYNPKSEKVFAGILVVLLSQ